VGVIEPLEKVIEMLAIALAQGGQEVAAIGSGGLAEGAGERRITQQARAEYVSSYRSDAALTAGFDFYRAFPRDAQDNAESGQGAAVDTPLLYLRGEREGGDIASYAAGLRNGGVKHVTTALVPNAGHFTQEEAPPDVWRLIRDGA
jgi:pimeloyl-ACP methyl ester carboxylesterase